MGPWPSERKVVVDILNLGWPSNGDGESELDLKGMEMMFNTSVSRVTR